jgi:dTDP-4-dehydrorhamnose reductase
METDIFIIGADGLIGSHLAEKARINKIPWAGTSRKTARENIVSLDLRNSDEIRNLTIRPKITFLCAAETDLRKCGNNPAETRTLNVERTVQAARHLDQAGSAIVFLSSNLVFDGTRPFVPADAERCPATEYGKQKAEAEKILLDELDRVAIVRLTKVVHRDFPLFREWLAALRSGNPIRPFSDMPFSPVDLALVVEELWALGRSFQKGIFQLSGDSDIPYASAASILAKTSTIDAGLVRPQTTEQAGYLHPFPRHTALAHRPVRPRQKPESVSTTLERIFKTL